MGATGSKDSAGAGAAVGAVANRSIVRKQGANKEDLFTVATYSVLAGAFPSLLLVLAPAVCKVGGSGNM